MRLFNVINKLGGDLLSHAKSILSLALVRFTALFEMGRGGSKPLWPPSITGDVVLRVVCIIYSDTGL